MLRLEWPTPIVLAVAFELLATGLAYSQVPGNLSPQDAQAIGDAYGKLSPQDKAKVNDEVKKLPQKQQEELAAAYKRMSPEEREALIELARGELKSEPGVKISNVIVGPGLPKSLLLEATDLFRSNAKDLKLDADSQKLFAVAQNHVPNIVLFRSRSVDALSNRGVGIGILISKSLVLTARHVAQDVFAKPSEFSLTQVGEFATKDFLTPLTLVSAIDVGADASGDPDLALIRVAGAVRPKQVSLRTASLNLRQGVVCLGSFESELLPAMSTGIVTTSIRARDLAEALGLKRTVFGSSVRSFPGLSGAPVFDADGKLVAVILGGVKTYAKTGETLTPIGEGVKWETFRDWTWATPLNGRIADEVKKDK
jgi:S1-C subfamily serine protease